MYRKTVSFIANEQILSRTSELIETPSGCINIFHARFELGKNWGNHDKVYAVWSQGDIEISTDLDENGHCVIPAEVLDNVGAVQCNLVGETDGKQRLTTYICTAIVVAEKVQTTGAESKPIKIKVNGND